MKRIFLMLLPVVILTACQSGAVTGETVTTQGGSYKNVTPDELMVMLENEDFVFVNVHIPFAGDITGTDVSIAYDEIDQHLFQLPSDKTAKIVLYCRSGRMSLMAAEKLVSLGYTNIWNLDGGMVAWEQAGYEIEK